MSDDARFIQRDLSVIVRDDDVVGVTDETDGWTYAESFAAHPDETWRPRELALAGAVMVATAKVLRHRAEQANAALKAERERADRWEWVAVHAKNYGIIMCPSDEVERRNLNEVDFLVAHYDAAHPSPETEESVVCPDCGEEMSGPELAVHRCGETP